VAVARAVRGLGDEQGEQPLVDALVGEILDLGLALGAHHVDRALHEVAHHRLDVAAHVPTSVNFEASTFTNGAPASLASRRAISVFPLPVGPMRMMLFDAISGRTASGARCRRQRLRSAMATAFFASPWPTMYRSSSATIWRGVRSASLAIACCVLFDSMGAELSGAGRPATPRRPGGRRTAPPGTAGGDARRPGVPSARRLSAPGRSVGPRQVQQLPLQALHLPQQGASSHPQAHWHFGSSQQQAASRVGIIRTSGCTAGDESREGTLAPARVPSPTARPRPPTVRPPPARAR
jgi:hypothetical protein